MGTPKWTNRSVLLGVLVQVLDLEEVERWLLPKPHVHALNVGLMHIHPLRIRRNWPAVLPGSARSKLKADRIADPNAERGPKASPAPV
jgi:hypothetical protein